MKFRSSSYIKIESSDCSPAKIQDLLLKVSSSAVLKKAGFVANPSS